MPLNCNAPLNQQQKALLTCEAFWSFSLEHYKKSEVQQAALILQDKHNGNVNLALLLIWLDSLEIQFSQLHLHALKLALSPTDTLLFSYRALRKKIKLTNDRSLYQHALNFELQLEKQQQADLIDTLSRIELLSVANNIDGLLYSYCCSLNAESLLFSLQIKKGS
ncbi:TIGR02444 family protein [Aliivibrio sp. 1S128]|uniref:TIGR02444 family protein n=1 Tax=Aliivibrio sp. 1S128 TaxID=1840085 RepID=UPI00080EC320|nr:TIGR02444 family protein [Aliivibrio sp. 1S128]OCH25548.1 TIGR02444 family protein [Aliivibrio sp. 1S128]